MKHVTRIGLGLALLAGLAAATIAFLPSPRPEFVPLGAHEVAPDSLPPMWEYEYRAVALCAGIEHADPYRVRWYLVPSDYTGIKVPAPGTAALAVRAYSDVGIWTRPHNIYIPEVFKNFEWVIRHEALHDLVGKKPHRGRLLELLQKCKATWGYLE